MLAWLRQHRGLRFLAYLHYMDPHDPYTPPASLRPPPPTGVRPEIATGVVEGITQRMNHGREPQLPAVEVAHLRNLYDAEIRAWDDSLAALLAAIDRLGLRDSTVIVVTSDHGEEFQEHGRLKHGTHLYEESTHVPLVIAGPGIAPGRVATTVEEIDVFPTLAALLGATAPPGLPGTNVLGPIAARAAISETLLGVGTDGASMPVISVRTAEWKLIRSPALGRDELYDLRRDPGEHDDRFDAEPEGRRLIEALAAWEQGLPAPPPVEGRDPTLRDKLRALGYIE